MKAKIFLLLGASAALMMLACNKDNGSTASGEQQGQVVPEPEPQPEPDPEPDSADDAEPASYPASERGVGRTVNGNQTGDISGTPYKYEFWKESENGTMTYYNNGTFECSFTNASDFLVRVGYRYGSPAGPGVDHKTKNYVLDYKEEKSGRASFSYIGAYGWTADPQMEFFIVEDWFGSSPVVSGGTKKGEITVNGATYDIYTVWRSNAASVTGTSSFMQVYSIRKSSRQQGRIHISAHFKKWEELGIGPVNPVEVSFLGEAGGNATGSFECTYLDFKENFPN
ncbi:MAG: glycoside hydrolase family 11 protein [Bacteroidales bacterium]|nr:glycoside hydrolase family 11 protein [Bacteroidales bacterium]